VDFDQLILARKAINKIDAIGKIDGARIPTLVLVGDQFGQSFIEINRKIANGIKGSTFMVLKNSMDPSSLVNPDDSIKQYYNSYKSRPNHKCRGPLLGSADERGVFKDSSRANLRSSQHRSGP
jgi:hypothetical protein